MTDTNKERVDLICERMIRKNPESVSVVVALLLVGLRKGFVTAEDAHDVQVSHPNLRGAVMRQMSKFGFQKGELMQGTTTKSHSHLLFRWDLVDSRRARDFLNRLTSAVAGRPDSEPQMQLL